MIYTHAKKVIVIIGLGCSFALYTMDEDPFDFEYDEDLLEFSVNQNDITSLLHKRRSVSPELIVSALNDAQAITILEEDIYLHTNKLENRSILDLPSNTQNRCCRGSSDKRFAGVTLFWNQTNSMNFRKKSTHLSSYLALNKDSFIDKIENVVAPLVQLFDQSAFNIDVKKVFGILSCMSIQQRRLGLMAHGTRAWQTLQLHILCPVYYFERNFFLTDQDRDTIAQEFGFDTNDLSTDFQDAHFVSDKLGIGDTRIEFTGRVIDNETGSLNLGIMATIPTAFSFKNGLKGSHFRKNACLPEPTLIADLFALALDSDTTEEQKTALAFERLRSFGIGALDRLAAATIEAPLGNGGHLGIGALLCSTVQVGHFFQKDWIEQLCWNNRLSIEYLLPGDEKRFFVEKNSSSDFATRDFNDPEHADDNLKFIEREVVRRFYPVAFDVHIQPGIIFRWDSRLCYAYKKWHASIGGDVWIQPREKFGVIDAYAQLANRIDVEKAHGSTAAQLKLVGTCAHTFEQPTRSWHLGLYADATILRTGIGRDFSIGFNVNVSF